MKPEKYVILTMLVAVLITFSACGGKKNQPDGTEGWVEVPEKDTRDSTIYGLCTMGTTMNQLQMVTDNGDTLMLSTVDCNEEGKVFGDYKVGDRMAVLAYLKANKATMVVNQTMLMGDWVMPNPIDGSSEMGVSIREGGIAESINQNFIVYRTWRLVNGSLELVNVIEDAGDFEEREYFELLYLSADSLAFRDSETTFEYKHPSPPENYDDLNVELEEGSFEDFVM